MPLKTRNMKFINKTRTLFGALFLILGVSMNAQEIIPISVTATDTLKPQFTKRQKVDGIVATVGDYIILDSDIDKAYLEISGQGNSVKDITRCQLLGKLMEDKLYAHHAIQDSIVVTDEQVKDRMGRQIDYMVQQLGTMDKVVHYFKKDSEDELRTDLFEVIKTNALTEEMQRKIVDEVEITPEEVRTFFRSIPQDDLPVFGAEVEVAQIVIKPKISQEEKQKVIDKLTEIRDEVLAGSSFYTKAVLYSQDPGSRSSGGFYKMTRKTPFIKEFKDVAFTLGEGEISMPFETDFGYHIILVEKIRGQEVDLRHILLSPKVTSADLAEAKTKIELIKKRIEAGELTFAEAARTLSDEKETKANGGALINPNTQDTRFELTKMDPELYSQISSLKENEISYPIMEEDRSQRKSYKIIKITNRTEEHKVDYAKDYVKIKNLALKEKQIKVIGAWSEAKIKETYIKINGEYRNCEFTNNWIKK